MYDGEDADYPVSHTFLPERFRPSNPRENFLSQIRQLNEKINQLSQENVFLRIEIEQCRKAKKNQPKSKGLPIL